MTATTFCDSLGITTANGHATLRPLLWLCSLTCGRGLAVFTGGWLGKGMPLSG
jgi:hypothetical protein